MQRRDVWGKVLAFCWSTALIFIPAGARPVVRGTIPSGGVPAVEGGRGGGGGLAFLWNFNLSLWPATSATTGRRGTSQPPNLGLSRWVPSLFKLRGWSDRKQGVLLSSSASSAMPGKKRGAKAAAASATDMGGEEGSDANGNGQIDFPAKKKRGAPVAEGKVQKKAKPAAMAQEGGSGGGGGAKSEEGATKAAGEPAKPKSKGEKVSGGKDDAAAKPKSPKNTMTPLSTEPPEGWREIYDLCLELRKERDAPVDWAGSEALGINHQTGEVDAFNTFIALMLSSQTKDQVVGEAVENLKASPGGLTVDSILAMSDEELDGYIAKVGFHNNKTKFIKQSAQIMKEQHGGKVPNTPEGLMALPGIGPKMAFIILHVAYGIVAGIGVDTHMHRIFNIIGWVKSKTPEQTRLQLEAWLPREEWDAINILIVGLGQMTQQPVERAKLTRRCLDCSQPITALKFVKRIGCDLNSPDPATGATPLMLAAGMGNKEAVELLLAVEKSKVSAVDKAGKNAREYAADAGYSDLAEMLGAREKSGR